jgi:fatty-acyl-CoA synthase
MSLATADTLVSCLGNLPGGDERGFRFRGLDGSERNYPWHLLHAEAKRRGQLLLGLDLHKGDRIALVIADPAEFVLSFLGAAVAGIVPVPIYPRASFKAKNSYVETVTHIVQASGAKVLLTTEASKPVVEEVLAHDSGLSQLVVLEELVTREAADLPLPAVSADDICFLQFTSGSTSMPKGVIVTHGNLVANARAFLGPRGIDRRPEDIAVTWLPLYHDMGLIGFVLGTIVCDIPTVLMPTEAFGRRPNVWLETITKVRGTITFAPNFAYALASKRARDKDLESLDLSTVRVAGCGAEPINPKVMREFGERFSRAGFKANALMPAYGMAESTLAITFHELEHDLVTDVVDAERMQQGDASAATASSKNTVELVCCGHVFPGHQLKIVDENGNTLPDRRVGEIWAHGPSVTGGYYGNSEATAACYTDGWLHTGDLGYMVGDDLYVCGRLKDLIIVRGANHYPQDIEWAVAEIEGVRRDNVVAFSVVRDGEEGVVIAAEGNSGDAEALRKAIAAKVAETSGLTVSHVSVVKVGSLPKTSSGKVQRRRTKALFESGLLEEHPSA